MSIKNNIDSKQRAAENEALRARLDEAEETLRAIRSGEVDALVVSGADGDQVFVLKGADQSYRLLIEEMGEGAFTASALGVILFSNKRFSEMLKTPLEKVIGSFIHSWIAPDCQNIVHSLLKNGVEVKRRGELALIASDGTQMPVHVTVSRLLIQGEPDVFCLVATDLTEQKRNEAFAASQKLERELLAAANQSRRQLLSVIEDQKLAEESLRQLNEQLEERIIARTADLEHSRLAADEASRSKSDFLANMSHELRTPLNSIIGFSEMLKDGVLGNLDKKQHGFTADIFDAGTHLLSLINDILDLSKVEAGMLQLEADVVEVASLLKASTLVVREKAHAHRIQLDTQLDPALGTLLADERKVKQMVYNLLSNAVKFTPDGGVVTLRARRCTRAEVALDPELPGRVIALPPGEDNEFLAITVEDSGIGIAGEHLAKLFEPFTQVDSSAARHQEGTGLGLSLVRGLAELHGGTVGVASRPGAGSRFSVWLPYRAAAPVVQETRAIPEGIT